MQSINYIDLLRGRCQNLPDVRSKVVRVFLSSTFSDTLSERDSLIDTVFPKLKDYCREKYGLEFQYADMRWGIQIQSNDNHTEVETCLNEIEICKKYSLATNFVVLLSHRYGSRPTPAIIHTDLFELLLEIIRSNSNDDAQLLSQWYQLDTNRIPAAYILRPISSSFPNILSSNTNEMKQAEKDWEKINNYIRTCLRQAAAKCFEQKQIDKNEYDNFFISVTEKEILHGILSASDANQQTLCFLREIENIHDHITDSKASKFIDLQYSNDGQPKVDSEAENLLNNLKHKRIPSVLQSSNIYSYKVHWTPMGINRKDHIEYITRFNDDFYNAIKQQIDQCIQSRILIDSDSLQHEILEHAIQCKTYVAKFHGRIDVLNRVLKWWSDRSFSVILRFLGTTRSSSTIRKTLLSISQQICKLYNLSMDICPDILQLRHQLETNLFSKIPENEYLIILLDSIDQLETDAYDCQWLPKIFPKNIKCIISTLPEHGNILSNLKIIINYDLSLIENTQHLLVFIPPFEASTVDIVFNDWLQTKQRSLSNEQRLFIRQLMEDRTEILPLFMKLIFDIISTWHSYDPIDDQLKKLRHVDDCICYLFNHLQKKHNSTLFHRALCYMTACRSGISQNELEDVLSLDNDVLKSVFQHYIPPVQRLPGILWTRIRNDLDEYITEKEIDDSSVIYWYHRRFIEVVNTQYISKLSVDERKIIFGNMVDLYKETWKGKNKPIKIDDPKLIDKYDLKESNGEIHANRFITSQPIEFVDVNGRVQFNKRKLNELPQFLSKLAPSLSIPIAVDEIFFNYSFMRAKILCSDFDDIITLFYDFQELSSYKLSKETVDMKGEIKILFSTFMICGLLIQEYPDNFAFEISSRLLPLMGIKENITRLVKQFDEQHTQYCALIVPYCQMRPPGSGLLYSMNKHTTSVVDLDFTDDQLTAISLSDRIVVINMTSGNAVLDINLPNLNESYLNSTTLPKIYHSEKENKNSTNSNNENTQFQQMHFLVNSFHHIYLVSAHNDIKFERTSKIGFHIVEFLDIKRGLCIIAEIDSYYIECWDVVRNRLFSRIELSSSKIKNILCTSIYSMIIIVCQDGNIHFYSIKDWIKSSFIHCASIQAGQHLNLVAIDGRFLICTFDTNISSDFAIIDLKLIHNAEQTLIDNQIIKILVTFDPPITPRPIKHLVLPNKETIQFNKKNSNALLFTAITNDGLYIVHYCIAETLSYVRIDGHYDLVSMHAKNRQIVYTARQGIIDIHKWKCIASEDDGNVKNNAFHKYQLYVSIDISSSFVTTIKPSAEKALIFLCSMENGVIHAYHAGQARRAYKKMPPFPRTNEPIDTVELFNRIAVTLDRDKRELSTWLYQHSTSIESTRHYQDSITVSEFSMTLNKLNETMILIAVITNNNWLEIYSSAFLHKKPLFSLHLHSPAKIHGMMNGTFLLLRNTGSLCLIVQQMNANGKIEFNQSNNIQLKIKCSMMFSSLITLNFTENLVVLADNRKSLAIWTINDIIYIDIDLSSVLSSSSRLINITSERTQDLILLYFDNKYLLSCQIQLDQSKKNGSTQITLLNQVDQFCLKQNCLAAIVNKNNLLHLYSIPLQVYHKSIQLENQCEYMCLNESGTYVFTVIKSHTLYMYRINDQQQLAKLFLYDLVASMKADHDFLVLAMNDRRLLTLMIADPIASNLQEKIQTLPSRILQRTVKSATVKLVEHIQACADMNSSDEDDDDGDFAADDDNNENDTQTTKDAVRNPIQKTVRPVTSLRFVTRLNGRHSQAKMNTASGTLLKFIELLSKNVNSICIKQLINDSDEENHNDDDVDMDSPIATNEHQYVENDLNDIRQKTFEYDQQQLKGIHLANVGNQNLKVINSYSVTSNTCIII
ncbi:unnamed protein product [Rotaria sordida]|uniref:Uncharacterized protein n=1 Tax=Rotaria sordida TaxID=392033 RepID=A0A819LD33_9BILA|nr:unnamed protein product [Rotaria sordida]